MTTSAIEELKQEGRLYVAYPKALRDAVARAMEAWRAFYALPEGKKILWEYEPDAKTSGNGYELKKGETGTDLKEDVHLRVVARTELMARAALVHPTIGPEFVDASLAVIPLIVPLVQEFGRAVEKEYGIEGFEQDILSTKDTWLLRFLHYFGGDEPVMAAAHADKGGFTLHLYESDPGVERLDYDTREWVEMPLSHEETVIIPGIGLQNRSKCELRALYHRVVATEKTAKTGRDSAVCFFNFGRVRFFDKSKFGSQQSQPVAWNYDFTPERFAEFDQYFID